MADRPNRDRDEQRDEMPRGTGEDQVRGIANESDEEFDETEDMDEEADEDEEGTF